VEVFLATVSGECPSRRRVADFLAEFRGLQESTLGDVLFERTGEDAVRHLFMVAASLDSMVVGEAQILSQVKNAYELACRAGSVGPLTNAAFQAALRIAKRVARETTIHERRVSIPSVAVADFASQVFDRLDNKQVVVLGAGEMGQETLRYLVADGVRSITVINRNPERARDLARQFAGTAKPWEQLFSTLVTADLVIGTTGATEPIVTREDFTQRVRPHRTRDLFLLDLAVPRDFDPRIGDLSGVYLFSLDDLKAVCQANRRQREREWPKAKRIVDNELASFMKQLNHQLNGPTIRRLQAFADELRDKELQRLFRKLGDLDDGHRAEIERAANRLLKKLLHPPLASLRHDADANFAYGLLESLKRLFHLPEA
jgi:glutamyl-tRNA reductase